MKMFEIFVKKEVAEARLAVCEACPNYNTPIQFMCGRCACIMPMKTKLAMVNCPEDRWAHIAVEIDPSSVHEESKECCPGNETPIVFIPGPDEDK